jgi:tRNA dimethylallyltransferase
MMYYHVLENGLNELPLADESIRQTLNDEAREIGWAAMHAKLADVDPAAAERIKSGDTQRIQRALEVYKISGQALSDLQNGKAEALQMQVTRIILNVNDRALLHNRIEKRFHAMLEQGFIDEVASLKARGDLSLDMPSMRCVGYRQIWQFLEGRLSREEMIYKGIVATRQLAKRQMTWLRRQPQDNAFNCLNYRKSAIFKLLNKLLPDR